MANKLFEIEVKELLCRVMKIKAKSYSAALDIIKDKYKRCEIVLDYNDFVEVSFQDINKQSIKDEKNNLILEIIDYLYEDEKLHFLESDKISRKNHIFQKLESLKSLCIEE
jgi:hypothetical protein